MNKKKHRSRTIPPSVRAAVIERDGMVCRRCGRTVVPVERGVYRPDALHLDHIVEWAAGGDHSVENLIVCCAECNLARPRPSKARIERGRAVLAYYTATIEVALSDPSLEQLEAAFDRLVSLHPAVSVSPAGYATATVRLAADGLPAAAYLALLAVKDAFGAEPITCQVMPTDEWDIRQGWEPTPELVSVAEAAVILGITRQSVLKRINTRQLPAQRVGRDYAIPRTALHVES